jgi:hypothetical protein
MITIKEAITKRINRLYQISFLPIHNEFWVPPIIADELESFDKKKIRFKSAEAYFYLAYRNNEIGRISAIVNWGK